MSRNLTILVAWVRRPPWRRRYQWVVRTAAGHTLLNNGWAWTLSGAMSAAMRARATIAYLREAGGVR